MSRLLFQHMVHSPVARDAFAPHAQVAQIHLFSWFFSSYVTQIVFKTVYVGHLSWKAKTVSSEIKDTNPMRCHGVTPTMKADSMTRVHTYWNSHTHS